MNCIFLRRGYGSIGGSTPSINYVEWIGSNGSQYIDTGFKPNQDTRVVLECEPTTTISAQQAVFGARNTNSGQASQAYGFNFMSTTSARLDYMGSNSTISGTYSSGTKVSVDVNKNTCTVNGTTGSVTAKTGQSQHNMFLFNVNNYGTPHSSFSFKGKIYYCKIYDNGTLVRDYKPAYDPDGVACMYDELSKTYYYNKGSGTFTAGASVGGGDSGGDTPEIKSVFADNEWSAIIYACQNNLVPSSWAVGNSKAMLINGTNYDVVIIGKNHDTYASGGTAPITFQLKNCYNTTYQMNSSATNRNGWSGSAMRSTHLPTILSQMPNEVQSAIKEVSKKTSAGGQSSTINTTADKLFLIAHEEVFGYEYQSYEGEGTRYEYYSSGNRNKTRNGSASTWWLRSPTNQNSTSFRQIGTDGVGSTVTANTAGGVSFAFCF